MNRQLYGKAGEDIAANYLLGLGYAVVASNYRCDYGEIDLIAVDRNVYVFVEVKRRTGMQYGRPCEAVTKPKQRHIALSAVNFLKRNRIHDVAIRFDVIEIIDLEINHIIAAFDSDIRY